MTKLYRDWHRLSQGAYWRYHRAWWFCEECAVGVASARPFLRNAVRCPHCKRKMRNLDRLYITLTEVVQSQAWQNAIRK